VFVCLFLFEKPKKFRTYLKQRSGRERLEGATPWSMLSQRNKASMSALEKNQARIDKSLIQLFARVL
jgi:hypothetical protein